MVEICAMLLAGEPIHLRFSGNVQVAVQTSHDDTAYLPSPHYSRLITSAMAERLGAYFEESELSVPKLGYFWTFALVTSISAPCLQCSQSGHHRIDYPCSQYCYNCVLESDVRILNFLFDYRQLRFTQSTNLISYGHYNSKH
jgi:hypothetical protein